MKTLVFAVSMDNLIFVVLLGSLLFGVGSLLHSVYRVLARYQQNNLQPVRTQRARLVKKAQDIWLLGESKGAYSANCRFRAIFELCDSQERLTFSISALRYCELLEEGHTDLLTYQGTRFLGFGMHSGIAETCEHARN